MWSLRGHINFNEEAKELISPRRTKGETRKSVPESDQPRADVVLARCEKQLTCAVRPCCESETQGGPRFLLLRISPH